MLYSIYISFICFVQNTNILVQSLSRVQLFCNPMDRRLPGSSVHGISPGKNTGVAISFSRGLSHPGIKSCIGRRILQEGKVEDAVSVHNDVILQQAGGVREVFLEELSFKLNLKDKRELLSKKGEKEHSSQIKKFCSSNEQKEEVYLEYSLKSFAYYFEYQNCTVNTKTYNIKKKNPHRENRYQ